MGSAGSTHEQVGLHLNQVDCLVCVRCAGQAAMGGGDQCTHENGWEGRQGKVWQRGVALPRAVPLLTWLPSAT